jgi:chitin synthase
VIILHILEICLICDQAREDVDGVWEASKAALQNKQPEEEEMQHRDATTEQTDHDRNSRTYTVLAWIGTNVLIILVFTSLAFQNWAHKYEEANSTFNPYLSFLFYALASLSAIRFLGSTLYLILRLCGL